MIRTSLTASLTLAASALALAGCQTVADAVTDGSTASLTGAAEVPGPGDPDGSGMAEVNVVDDVDRICYKVQVAGIAPATAAHIHRGAAGTSGPPVVTLDAPTDGSSEGCTEASDALAEEIENNPSSFYVNVHNSEYPDGAVRGQLMR